MIEVAKCKKKQDQMIEIAKQHWGDRVKRNSNRNNWDNEAGSEFLKIVAINIIEELIRNNK